MEKSEKIKDIKIILLGDVGVGKTSIISRYYKNEFNTNMMCTATSTYILKVVKKNGISYNLNIWDTSGQERYRSVTKLFVQGANIVILVYAVDFKETFDIIDYWHKTVMDLVDNDENMVLAIVGNKIDKFDEAVISEEEGKKLAHEKNAIFKSVSAKADSKGIFSLFDTLLDEYIKKNKHDIKQDSFKVENKKYKKNRNQSKNKNGCC